VGLDCVEVDRERIHELPADRLAAYAVSDASLARQMAERRWATARLAVDPSHPNEICAVDVA
jgi:hypothetical protein